MMNTVDLKALKDSMDQLSKVKISQVIQFFSRRGLRVD